MFFTLDFVEFEILNVPSGLQASASAVLCIQKILVASLPASIRNSLFHRLKLVSRGTSGSMTLLA